VAGKENRGRFYVNLLFALSILLVGASLILLFVLPKEIDFVDVYFNVKKGTSGFNLNSSALTFGTVSPGGGAVRNITLINDEDREVKIKVFISRNIADFIIATPDEFSLGPWEKQELRFKLIAPLGTEEGEYQGRIKIETFK